MAGQKILLGCTFATIFALALGNQSFNLAINENIFLLLKCADPYFKISMQLLQSQFRTRPPPTNSSTLVTPRAKYFSRRNSSLPNSMASLGFGQCKFVPMEGIRWRLSLRKSRMTSSPPLWRGLDQIPGTGCGSTGQILQLGEIWLFGHPSIPVNR